MLCVRWVVLGVRDDYTSRVEAWSWNHYAGNFGGKLSVVVHGDVTY
jgi:hypothetical protein